MNHIFFSFRRVQFAIATLVASLFCVANVYAQTAVSYTGMGSITCPTTPTATISPSVSGLTFSQLSRGSGVTCGSASTGISGTGFNGTLSSNITNSKWYLISITSNASTTFTLSAISIVSQVSNSGGSPNVSVQYSIGGSTPSTVIGSFTPTGSSASYNVNPGSAISVGASQTLNIYIIPNNLNAAGTTCRIENNTSITVTTTPVCNAPTTQLSIGTLSSTVNSMTIPVTAGNGDSRLVRFNTAAPSLSPADGTVYTAATSYATAATEQTVMAGSGNSVTVTNLVANTVYYYKAWEYNACSGSPKYNTTSAPSGSFTTLSKAPTVGSGSSITSSSFTAAWTAPASQGAATYTYEIQVDDDAAFGSVNFTQSAIASGTTSVSVNSGLSPNTTYYYRVRANNAGGSSAWSSNSAGVTTSVAAATINTPIVSTVNATSAVLGATISSNGGGTITDYGVYYSTSTGVTTSSTKLSLGTTNYSGAFTGTLSSLSAATQYFFKGYATNSIGTVLTSEQSFYTLSTIPSAYPASFTATANSTTQIDLSFSKLNTISNCAGYLIIQSSSSTLSSNPVNGTAYSVGNTIGNGTVAFINTSNGASTASITGLNVNSTYYYFLFPYNWDYSNAATYNYKTGSNPSANATTLAPPAPSVSSLSAASGYYGSTLSVYGTNMGNVTSITIGGVSMTNYTVVSSTQIDVTINNASANGAVVLNHLGGSVTGSNYTVNGYITSAALTYTTASCWLGGAVPPAGAVVNIAHTITVPSIALASAPSTIRIMNGGAMTTTSASTGYQTAALSIDAGGTLTVGPNAVWNINAGGLTNNGTINLGNTFGGTIKITGGSFVNNSTFNQGTGKIDFTGTCTLATANTSLYNLDVNGALTLPTGVVVNNVLNMNSGASIVANGLTYGSNAYVSYNASMSPGLEWPINVSTGTSIPNAVTIAGSSTLTLNGTGTHQVKGNLVLNGTLVLSGSNDIAVSGDISGTGTLTAGTRKLSFNGTTQNLNAALSFYDLDVLCSNLYIGAGTTVNNKLLVTAADTLTTKLGFTLSIQSSALNPSVINGTFINQGTISVGTTGGLTVANGATFIHNTTTAISTNLSRTILAAGSTFVYRGNSALIPAMSVSNRTYHNLRFESTSGSWVDNIGFTGTNNCTINGDLFIGAGVTLLNASYTGIWNIAGNVQVDGVMPSNQLSASLTGANKTLTGSGTVRFKTITIPGSYTLATSFTASTSATVTGTLMAETYVVSGAAFTLSAGGTLGIGHNQGITSSGNQGNIQTTTRSFSTAANYIYNGTASQPSGSGLPATVSNLTINNTGIGSNNMVTLSQTTTVTGTLNLMDGHFSATGAVELIVANTAANAIIGHASMALANNSSYVEGNLRRKVTTGVYDFPLGTSQNYQLAIITVNSNTNVDNILVSFDKFATGCGYNGNTPNFYAKPTNGSRSTLVDDMLNFGYYTVEPYDATNTLVTTPNISYDAQMLFNGHNNGVNGYTSVNSSYTLMKKPACGGAWGLYGGSFNTNNNQAQNSNSGAVALKLQGLVSFSQFGAGFSNGTILPLEMTNFVGEQVNGANQLSWTTLSEESTIKFVIERSENADDFTAIGEVAAKGARNSGADYSFLDEKAGTGIHYYRLKAVDVDGNVSYSEMIALGTKGAISNFNVYPNPAANEIHFAYQLLQANTQATLKVYSMTGALMHTEVLTKNTQEYLLDTRDYQNGLYFYEILSSGQKLFTGKFDISK